MDRSPEDAHYDGLEKQGLLAKTQQAAKDGAFEKYKTSHHFDGTVKNPRWLG